MPNKYSTLSPNEQPQKVALYCRVSTEEQAKHGESISDQLQALRRYCAEHNYIIVGEYLDEGFSARKSYRTRPALRDMLAAVERREFSLILMTKLDRYFRNVGDYYRTQEILERNKCSWQAILESFETVSSEGRFKLNLLLSLSERESAITSDRVKFTVEEKRRRGEYIGGTPPMGYMAVGKKIVKDPALEMAVTAMFNVFLETHNREAAYQAGTALGYPCQKKTMTRAMDKCSRTHTGTVNGIAAEPYLTMEQALEIEQALSYRGRLPREQYIFGGLVFCGACGGRMSGHRNYGNGQRHKKYRLYNCTNHYNYGTCHSTVNYRELMLEEELLRMIEPALESYRYNASRAPRKTPKRDTKKMTEAIEQRKARLLDAYIDGVIDKSTYRAKQAQLEAELAAVPVEQAPVRIPPHLPIAWRKMYDDLTPDNKRVFWRRIISKIIISADRSIEIDFASQ